MAASEHERIWQPQLVVDVGEHHAMRPPSRGNEKMNANSRFFGAPPPPSQRHQHRASYSHDSNVLVLITWRRRRRRRRVDKALALASSIASTHAKPWHSHRPTDRPTASAMSRQAVQTGWLGARHVALRPAGRPHGQSQGPKSMREKKGGWEASLLALDCRVPAMAWTRSLVQKRGRRRHDQLLPFGPLGSTSTESASHVPSHTPL